MTIQMLSKLITCIILIATASKQSKSVIPEIEMMINNAKSKIDKILLSSLLLLHIFIGITFIVVLFYPIVSPLIMIIIWFISSLTTSLVAYNKKLRAKYNILENYHDYECESQKIPAYVYMNKDKVKIHYSSSGHRQHVLVFNDSKHFSKAVYYFFDDGSEENMFKNQITEIENTLMENFLKTINNEENQLIHKEFGSEDVIGYSIAVISEKTWKENNLSKEMFLNNVIKKADLRAFLNEVE